MWKVYVIQNEETKEKYIGLTINLDRRIKDHNKNKSGYTSGRSGKWILIYYEAYQSKEDAIRRERRLKEHGKAKQELYKRIEGSLMKLPDERIPANIKNGKDTSSKGQSF